MISRIPRYCAALAFLTSVAAAQPADPQAAENGRVRFRIYCSPCHGIRGEGGRGPDLTLGTYMAGDRDQDLFRVVANGVAGTEMQGYHDTFGDEGVAHVVAYIRSISRKEPAPGGDRKAGSALYWGKGACSKCHMVNGKGQRSGPDLTAIGRKRSYAHLKQSVIAPNEDVTAGYATIVVTLRDGKKITGVERGFDNFSVRLMDASENIHSFVREEVNAVERQHRSTMPGAYGKLFTEAELKDLLAYLSGLRGKETQP